MRVEVPVEPLTALAGGLIGGALVATLAWRHIWRIAHTTTHRGAHP